MLTEKQEKTLSRYQRDTAPEDLCMGQVSNADLKPGAFRFLPLLGWVRKGAADTNELWVQGMVLLNHSSDPQGTLNWCLPLTERVLGDAAALLEVLGWDGRVWPLQEGWPDPQAGEAQSLRELLKNVGLVNSLVFRPDPEAGCRVLPFVLGRSNCKPFPMPPPTPSEGPSELTARLKELSGMTELFRPQPA